MVISPVLKSFFEQQEAEAMNLAARSDLIEVAPLGDRPHRRFIVRFMCKTLVKSREGLSEYDRVDIGIHFPLDYWQRAEAPEVVTLLGPANVFHPNVNFPFVCPGDLSPGTPLADIIYQCYEILTFQKVTMREDDALNKDACVWARKNKSKFPVDSRPLVRRRASYRIKDAHTSEATP
jgi:hypothetical protein